MIGYAVLGGFVLDAVFGDPAWLPHPVVYMGKAISTLENLQASGKTIGLISHVELLKERLTTQVRVLRGAGGTSRIQVVS